jgi:hypothetical protein
MTMTLIASQTVGGSAAQLSFSSIPQTYTHLQIRIYVRATNTSVNEQILIGCNSDFTAGRYLYAHHFYSAGASCAISYTSNTASYHYGPYIPSDSAAANVYGNIITDIFDYSRTDKYKTIKSFGGYDLNAATGYVGLYSGVYADTQAISQLVFAVTGSPYNLKPGSVVSIYGVNANPVSIGI